MRRLFAVALIFFSGCRFTPTPASISGIGRPPYRIVLNYWGDKVNPIGGYADGRGWLADSECLGYMREGTKIDILKLGKGKVGTFTVERFLPPSEDPPDMGTVYLEGKANISEEYDPASHPMIGILDPLANPPKTTLISTNNETYRNITRDFLKGQGLGDRDMNEMFVSQVVKVDLEGDGTDEVFISVQASENYLTEFHKEEGGVLYSYLFMRKIVNGKVETFVLAGEQFERRPDYVTMVFSLSGFWDMDGDGVLEAITREAYYEGFGYGIYSFDGGKFIYRTGWGAGV